MPPCGWVTNFARAGRSILEEPTAARQRGSVMGVTVPGFCYGPVAMPHRRSIRPGNAREIVAVALPMVASLSCDTVMVFTDRWFVSKLGPSAMNAVFVGGLAAFSAQTFFTGLIGYTTALV